MSNQEIRFEPHYGCSSKQSECNHPRGGFVCPQLVGNHSIDLTDEQRRQSEVRNMQWLREREEKREMEREKEREREEYEEYLYWEQQVSEEEEERLLYQRMLEQERLQDEYDRYLSNYSDSDSDSYSDLE